MFKQVVHGIKRVLNLKVFHSIEFNGQFINDIELNDCTFLK